MTWVEVGCRDRRMGDGGAQFDRGAGEFAAQRYPVPCLRDDLVDIGDGTSATVHGVAVRPALHVQLGLVSGVVDGAKPLQISTGERGHLVGGGVLGNL